MASPDIFVKIADKGRFHKSRVSVVNTSLRHFLRPLSFSWPFSTFLDKVYKWLSHRIPQFLHELIHSVLFAFNREAFRIYSLFWKHLWLLRFDITSALNILLWNPGPGLLTIRNAQLATRTAYEYNCRIAYEYSCSYSWSISKSTPSRGFKIYGLHVPHILAKKLFHSDSAPPVLRV